MPCNEMWFTVTMKKVLLEMFPDRSASDFFAGRGWRTRFYERNGLSCRKATNVMPFSVEERVPKVLSFYFAFQEFCVEGGESKDEEWGLFIPGRRWNADEAPVEFSHTLDRTFEKVGTKRVWVSRWIFGPKSRSRRGRFDVLFWKLNIIGACEKFYHIKCTGRNFLWPSKVNRLVGIYLK